MNNALTPEPHDNGGLNPTSPEQGLPAPQSAWANHIPVFLVGMMGAGKTTIGKSLAKALHREFLDLDHELEARCGVRIPTIFEIEGEAGFRKRECQVLDDCTLRPGLVMATGGGAVLASDNRKALSTRGVVIYLRANVDELYAEPVAIAIGRCWQRQTHAVPCAICSNYASPYIARLPIL